jgi:hypothetical protein
MTQVILRASDVACFRRVHVAQPLHLPSTNRFASKPHDSHSCVNPSVQRILQPLQSTSRTATTPGLVDVPAIGCLGIYQPSKGSLDVVKPISGSIHNVIVNLCPSHDGQATNDKPMLV